MLFLLRIGIIVGCLYVVACTSPQTNPETRVVAETAPQSDKGQINTRLAAFLETIEKSQQIFYDAWKKRPVHQRIIQWCLRLFSPIL